MRSLTHLAWIGLACVLLVAVGFAYGYYRGYAGQADKVATARSDANVCISAAAAKQAVITQMKKIAAENTHALAAAKSIAAAAMVDRDKLQQKVTRLAHQHQQAIEDAAHEHPACAGLVDRPVCPAVARQLFGATEGHHAAGSHHRDP